MPAWFHWLVVGSLTLAAVSCAVFIASYSRVRWWKSHSGKNVMVLSVLLFSGSAAGSLYRLVPWVTLGFYVVVWFGIALVMADRTRLFWTERARRLRETGATVRTPDSPQ